jgi:Lon protease-like protein
MSKTRDLGLFPLDLVLLPSEKVPLHLFEPRYRQLYADCVLEDAPFVVVRADATGTADIGCSARFETLVQRFEDGRLSVVVQGIEPVRLIDETDGRLYFSALVEPLPDDPAEAPPELVEGVLRRFRALAGMGDEAVPGAPEGTPLSYAIAATLDLAAAPKQRLLESRDEAHRLALLTELLDDVDRETRHARTAATRASSNGKVSTP